MADAPLFQHTEATRRCQSLIEEHYHIYDCCGGNLHIALDDQNIDAEDIAWLRDNLNIKQVMSPEYFRNPDMLVLENEILTLLEGMMIEERCLAVTETMSEAMDLYVETVEDTYFR